MAIRFDNTADTLTRTTNLPSITGWTIMMWVMRLGDGSTGYEAAFGFGDSANCYAAYLSIANNGNWTITEFNSDYAGSAFANDTWYHIALTLSDTAANHFLGYLNGVLDITGTGDAAITAATLKLCGDPGSGSEWANFKCAAVKVYSAVLTAPEIAQEMRQYAPIRTANLNTFLPCVDRTVADNYVDWSGNGYSMTAAGTLTVEDGPPIPWNSDSVPPVITAASSAAYTITGSVTVTASVASGLWDSQVGYSIAGTGGTNTLENSIVGSEYAVPAGGPYEVQSIWAYYTPSATQFTTKCAIYTTGRALVANSTTSVITGVSGAAWSNFVFPGTKPVLTGGTTYVIVAWAQSRTGTNVISRDNPGAPAAGHTFTATYNGFPATIAAWTTDNTSNYSVYAVINDPKALTGAVAVASTIASAMLKEAASAAIVGSVTVTSAVAAALVRNRNTVIAGAVTVTSAIASVLAKTKNPALSGAVTVTSTIAAALAKTKNPVISGSVTVTSSIASSLVLNINKVLAGSVTVTSLISAALEKTKHPAIAGAVAVTSAVAAALAKTKNPTIAGSVTVTSAVAAALVRNIDKSLAGSVALTVVPSAALAKTKNPVLEGAVTVTSAIAGSFQHNINKALTGSITVTSAISGSPVHNINKVLDGSVTVTSVIAGSGDFTRNATLSGSVALSVAISGSTDFARNAAIEGDVLVPVTVASAMLHPGSAELNGSVTVNSTIAADLDYTFTQAISGTVQVNPAVAGSLLFNRNAALSGSVSVGVAVSSTLDYALNASVTGAVTVGVAVASTLGYNLNAVIAGAVTVSTVVSGTAAYATSSEIAGTVAVSIAVGAALDYTLNASLVGSVTIGLSVASALAHDVAGSASFEGFVTVTPLVSSTLIYHVPPTFTGTLLVALGIQGDFLYRTQRHTGVRIPGDERISDSLGDARFIRVPLSSRTGDVIN